MSKKQPNSNKKPLKAATFAIFLFVLGLAAGLVSFLVPKIRQNENWFTPLICVAAFLLFVGIILIAVCVDKFKQVDEESEPAESGEPVLSFGDDAISYLTPEEAQELAQGGVKTQTIEQKFEQISKMDRTQFVLYVAKLFSQKGYRVKLTPVADNHDVDMIAEKMGVRYAVSVFLCGRVLSEKELYNAVLGQRYYNLQNCMVVTNSYFDRTAVDYARTQCMTLVDRSVLAENFMK